MTIVRSNTFEGGTSGTTISTSNSGGTSGNAFDLVSIPAGNTATFTTSSYRGSLGGSLGFDTASSQGVVLRWGDTLSLTATAVRVYVQLNNAPTASGIVLSYSVSGGSRVGSLIISSSGKLQLQDGTGTLWTSTSTLPTATWLRLEMAAQPGTTTSNGFLAVGYATGDGSFTESTSFSTANVGTTAIVRSQIGKHSGTWPSGTTMLIDDWAVSDSTTFLGPSSVAVSVSGAVATVAVAAPTGTVSGDATIAGAVATVTAAAPAGTVSGGATVAGAVAPAAAAAPAGSVTAVKTVTLAGPVATVAAAAPAGSVSGSATVAGPVAAAAAAAPAGSVSTVTNATVAGAVATGAAAAPAGAVTIVPPGHLPGLSTLASNGTNMSTPIDSTSTATLVADQVTSAALIDGTSTAVLTGQSTATLDVDPIGTATLIPQPIALASIATT